MKRLILIVLAAMLVIQALAAALLGSERGSRWLLATVSDYVPGELGTNNVSGTWLAGINVGALHYQLPSVDIQAEAVQLKLDLSALWYGEVRAHWLYASNVSVSQTPGDSSDKPSFVMPDKLSLPFLLTIDDARLNGLSIHHPERQTVQLDLVTGADLSAWQSLKFLSLSVHHNLFRISATEGRLKLSQPYALKAKAQWSGSLPALSTIFETDRLEGEALLSGSLDRLHIKNRLVSPAFVSSEVDVQPFSPQRDFRSLHHWKKITLTGQFQSPVTLEDGKLELSSEQGLVSSKLEAKVSALTFNNVATRFSTHGGWREADQLSLSLVSADSTIQASGSARWHADDMAFDLAITESQIDTELIDQQLTGSMAIAANVRGSRKAGQWRIFSDSIRLDGTLLGNPASASLQARLDQNILSLNGEATYAGNHAALDMQVNNRIKGNVSLSLTNLSALSQDLDGAAEIRANISGTRKHPEADITVSSTDLQFRQYRINDLMIKGKNLGPASANMTLDASSASLWQLDRLLASRISLTLNGAHNNHSVDLVLERHAARLDGSVTGNLKSLWQWSGDVTSLGLFLPDNPPWQLLQPAALEFSPVKSMLAPLCLSDARGEACFELSSNDGQLQGSLNLSAISIAPLSRIIRNDIGISGSLDGEVELARSVAGRWQVQANATLQQGRLVFSLDTEDYPLELDQATFTGRLDGDALAAETSIVIENHGYARANLATGLRIDAPLSGELSVALTELRWLEMFLPQLRQNRGGLHGRLTFAGTRQSPLFNGTLQLRDAGTDIPLAGLSLDDISAELSGDGPLLRISAGATSGPGTLRATGSIDLSSGLPPELDLLLTGERFLALDLPEARVLIAPDLTLRGSPRLMMLRGNILISEASLRPQQLPEMAVRVSDDEIILNAPASQTAAVGFDTNIMLRLGSNVRFNGFGLDARLGGNLQLLSAPSRPVALVGDLRIEEGRYRAYGQNLAIERGLLIFQQRIDNPGLDILAVRRIPSAQVVAGVAITGTLQSPEARLTSEPPMEESEIMAWLLTGRGLSGTSETDNAMIAQALAVYGLEKGSGVTEKIGEKVGLDEITVGSNWETTDASLMLGKQISNRLYLRYAIGLFDALSTVMLRYTVSRRVHLEAQSGSDQQSIDLIYQIER